MSITLKEKDPDVQPGLTARFQFHQALHDNDLLKAIAALEVLKEMGQPLRDPDLKYHARQMTTLAERAAYQAFQVAEVGQERSGLYAIYETIHDSWRGKGV